MRVMAITTLTINPDVTVNPSLEYFSNLRRSVFSRCTHLDARIISDGREVSTPSCPELDSMSRPTRHIDVARSRYPRRPKRSRSHAIDFEGAARRRFASWSRCASGRSLTRRQAALSVSPKPRSLRADTDCAASGVETRSANWRTRPMWREGSLTTSLTIARVLPGDSRSMRTAIVEDGRRKACFTRLSGPSFAVPHSRRSS